MLRLEIILIGKVQRVNCRRYVQEIATDMRITGTLENMEYPNKVKIIAEMENNQLDEFINKLKNLPSLINVKNVSIISKQEIDSRSYNYMKIIRGEPFEELGERFDIAGHILYEIRDIGLRQLQKQDETLKKQDETLYILRNLSGKQDQMLQKQDQTIKAIENMKNSVNDRFDRLDTKYGKISEILERPANAIVALAEKR